MRGKGETVPLSMSLRPLTVFWGDLPTNKSAARKAEGEVICSPPAQLEEAVVGRKKRPVSSGLAAALAEKEHKQADDGKSKDDDVSCVLEADAGADCVTGIVLHGRACRLSGGD